MADLQSVDHIHNPTYEVFRIFVEERRVPVKFTSDTPLFGVAPSKWSNPNYLKDAMRAKKASVRVTRTRRLDFLHKNFEFVTMPFEEFIDKAFSTNNAGPGDDFERYYFRSIGENARKDVSDVWKSYPELFIQRDDFIVPAFAKPYIDERYYSSALRFSSRDCQLWTHYDMMDNILCEIVGRKKVKLWSPDQVRYLYVEGSTSRVVNIEEPDLEQFPKFAKAQCVECELGPGEVLFIPALWHHNVTTLEACVAVNIFWKHLQGELAERLYAPKDLYGNKDLVPAIDAFKLVGKACEKLKELPPYYREFYAQFIIANIKNNLGL